MNNMSKDELSSNPEEDSSQLIPPAEPLRPTGSGSIGNELSVGKTAPSLPSAGTRASDLDEPASQEFLWHVHQYINEYIRFGDTKAGLAAAAAGAILGTLYSAKAYVPLIRTPYSEWNAAAWLTVAATFFLLASAYSGLSVIRPRLRSTQSKGYVFWGAIAAHGDVDLLRTSFHSQSPRTLNDHLLHHLFDLSQKVAVPKYRSVSLCLLTLGIGGLLAVAALVLQ